MSKVLFLLWILVCSIPAFAQTATEGSLFASDTKGAKLGACPLKTTHVQADISGFMARVTVRQEFENKFTTPIEAVYVFPLSQNGAVDRMTMTVGQRTIHGKIMTREEARSVYEAAKSEGKSAALLDQERPNIFTQSVANIMPGDGIAVEISYVETLKYEDGAYEFVFPMTVAPRYIPVDVKDAARIAPPVAATREGHDVSIEVNLNAGVPVEEIRSPSHDIDQIPITTGAAKVALRQEKVIPNKDFILRYDVTGKRIEDAVLAHKDERGGYFTLILQPPDFPAATERTPKEIVFVLDTSGSMSGFPIEKAKEAMRLSLDGLYPDDTFNLITFAGDTEILFPEPVPATQANLEKAQAFLAGRSGNGGTEMMKAIKASLDPTDAQDHLRIVCFMTDGEVGNDDQIVAEVQKHAKARVFSFGIGSSVNRSLLDRIAQEGKGEATYVGLNDDGSKAAKTFYERVRTPLLTDLSIDWGTAAVADVYPARLTDLFTAKPVIVHGRYTKGGPTTIKLRGNVAGQPYERVINVNLPDNEASNDALATLWAHTRIDQLSSERLKLDGDKGIALDKTITGLGIEYGLMTAFTSFVAVEDRVVNQEGKSVTVAVPVELPDGMGGKRTANGQDEYIKVDGVGTGQARQINNLPVNGRAASPMMMSPGVLNAMSAVVEVRSETPMINTTDSSVTKTLRADSNGNLSLIASGGGGGGRSAPKAKAPSKSGSRTGSASGAGYGIGSGSGGGTGASYGKGNGNGIGDGSGVGHGSDNATGEAYTPEMKRDAMIKAKLHTWLYAVVARLAKPDAKPAANEALFVREGKAAVRIDLKTLTPAVLEKLKAAGVELTKETGKATITGRISLDKLATLAEIDEVKLILPQL